MATLRQPPPARSPRARRPRPADAQAEAAPPESTRDRLLATGLELASRQGLKGLSVRAVAAQAGVNLGSFVYHFGTRDAFVYELVERWYAPLMASLQLSAAGPDPLRDVLRQLSRWVSDNAGFLGLLLRDASAGEAGVQRFLATADQRHIALLLELIGQAQRDGRLRRADPTLQLMFLMGAVVLPVLMVQGLQDIGPRAFVQRLTALAGDPAAIDARLDWALQGLGAGNASER
jgi:AcrR family transcriptional regulator